MIVGLSFWDLGLPTPVALASVAVLGYLIGRQKQWAAASQEIQARREIKRAQGVAHELEVIAEALRRNLAAHHSSVAKFKQRLSDLSGPNGEAAWKEVSAEVETMLEPTMRLTAQIASAYDHIRQQTNHLMTFTEARTDALTGIGNRRALDEALEAQLALRARYDLPFAIAIVDIDNFKNYNDTQGHLHGDHVLKLVARLLEETARETDLVTRFGGEEFVVVMPQANLEAGYQSAERLRLSIERSLDITVSCGVTAAADGDNPQSMLSRADAALYSAKAAGRNCVYHHCGAGTSPSAALVAALHQPVASLDFHPEPAPSLAH